MRVLDGLAGALPQVGQVGMDGVAQQQRAVPAPGAAAGRPVKERQVLQAAGARRRGQLARIVRPVRQPGQQAAGGAMDHAIDRLRAVLDEIPVVQAVARVDHAQAFAGAIDLDGAFARQAGMVGVAQAQPGAIARVARRAVVEQQASHCGAQAVGADQQIGPRLGAVAKAQCHAACVLAQRFQPAAQGHVFRAQRVEQHALYVGARDADARLAGFVVEALHGHAGQHVATQRARLGGQNPRARAQQGFGHAQRAQAAHGVGPEGEAGAQRLQSGGLVID